MKFRLLMLLVALCLLCAFGASAQEITVEAQGAQVQIAPVEIEGEPWYFLPSFADREALFPDAQPTEEENVWQSDAGMIMQSDRLRALFLQSSDPVNEGRDYIENAPRHETSTTGSMLLVDKNGVVNCGDELRQIRGRGNSSWGYEKKPYQIKLENKADLLQTGDRSQRARTWVLLSETLDGSLLRNQIAMDLALEMGLSSTPQSEHVDLYYDGEYRGIYLLCEKVEMGEGRIDELDYDELIEAWNDHIGQKDLEKLPVGQGVNRFGSPFTYIEKLAESDRPDQGAFLLEMESDGTLSDRCFFRLSDGGLIACKNPENASEKMMRFISEKLQEAQNVLRSGGDITTVFDVDLFARMALLQEYSCNLDGYIYSSSFFVLPAGSSRFEPGPAWDFDRSFRFFGAGSNDLGVGFKNSQGWLWDFYHSDVFVERMHSLYEDVLTPLIEVLLHGGEAEYLHSLDEYAELIHASRLMNERRWAHSTDAVKLTERSFAFEFEEIRRFLVQRDRWMRVTFANGPAGADHINLRLSAEYGRVEETVECHIGPWSRVNAEVLEVFEVSQADEENYAVWELSLAIRPEEGYAFHEPVVLINGETAAYEPQDDGSLLVCLQFEDPTYRPVDYCGDDMGLVYNPEVYAQHYPELAAEYEDDPEGLLAYFCEEGMYEGQMGNAYFEPQKIRLYHPELDQMLGENWQDYYWEFLYYGFEEGWLDALDIRFTLPLVP